MQHDAVVQANRIRALYADSAATRAQLDAAETGLARTQAGLQAAQAAATELGAVELVRRRPRAVRGDRHQAIRRSRRVRDAGRTTRDGAGRIDAEDQREHDARRRTRPASRAGAHGSGRAHESARHHRGRRAGGDGEPLHDQRARAEPRWCAPRRQPGHARIADGTRQALIVPSRRSRASAISPGCCCARRQGDDRRWVRLGRTMGAVVEVTAGLRADDRVVVPAQRIAATGGR